MSKKHKRRIMEQERSSPWISSTTGPAEIHPNSTLGPNASLETPTNIGLFVGDSTTAPEIGEEEAKKEVYAPSTAAIVDKYVLSKLSAENIVFVVVIAISGWIFIQDNGAGKLNDWMSVFWTVQKCGALFGLLVVARILQWLYQKFFTKP